MKNNLSVGYSSDELSAEACSFAERHNLACTGTDSASSELLLNFTPDYIELRDLSTNTSIHVDFISGALEHRRKYGGGRGQTIARAIGLKQGTTPPSVIDATAGLGKDAFVFACLGCSVTLLERSPIIGRLVEDAISRASHDEHFNQFIEHGFSLIQGNAIDYLTQLDETRRPEVIYLDPMYPERKKSASVKKNMQILQKLLGHDEDTDQLLDAALGCATKRVVVKRPKGAESLSEKKPSISYESKKTRYDTYIIQHA
ncbi:MAG: class I SAM-dependent methyltransferase [Gammaproteobacteria bacterium]|nr:class I SAM-dependent methyltransferase [Gammaproteobacteria bacterium]MCW8911661.1 class I SAM-dependent methyltransferase [Gammaproteobacteria bacterium]MCW9004315.1 class I SAM-dependent methyltransferase [Gammaproteobacteria bacterium]MCW9056076.1 class I SAM-dependent methyltransferase [Gammaproteobacteria bacterium]